MTNPYPGRAVLTVDVTNLAITSAQAARLAIDLGKGNAFGLAALNASGKVVDAANVPVATTADVATAVAGRIHFWHSVSGAYPPRPAGTDVYLFDDPNLQPTNDGSTSGGGGMVPGIDFWVR